MFLPSLAFAQTSASLEGNVTDPSAAAMADVPVTATNDMLPPVPKR